MKPKHTSKFLNVDLDIESVQNLRPLVDELGEKVIVLHQGPSDKQGYLLCLESSETHHSPDSAIRALCSVIVRLSDRNQQVWNTACRKVFDIGCEIQTGQRASQVELHPETIKLIASLGATVGITCYQQEDLAKSR